MSATPEQIAAINAPVEAHVNLQAVPGAGKCLGKGTPVLLFNGTVVMVEDIKPGDVLMGPDSLPREVLSVSSGVGKLYRVVPVKGESWICNSDHILTLVYSGKDTIRDIPIADYLAETKSYRQRAKLFRVGISFPEQAVTLDPYLVGVWLGDGTRAYPAITNREPAIHQFCQEIAPLYGTVARITETPRNNSFTIRFLIDHEATAGKENRVYAGFSECLTEEGHKFIPQQYLVNSEESRLLLLAGLLDTDGFLDHNGFSITTKYPELREGILFLARSLGFAAYAHEKTGRIASSGFTGTYWRISISGETDRIPTKAKKARPRQQIKNVLRTGFSLEDLGEGEYFGFTLTGDGRFLLGDFTVTHNTYVIERRIKFLIDNGVDPKNILVITFSHSQAEDMAERIFSTFPELMQTALLDGLEGNSQVTTIHGACRRMLNAFYTGRYNTLYGQPHIKCEPWRERSILEKWVEDHEWTWKNPYSDEIEPVGYNSILYWINRAKREFVPWTFAALEEFFKQHECAPVWYKLTSCALDFQKALERADRWTFADLFYDMEKKLQDDPAFREHWSSRFSHILVDEAQDTNAQAMRIVAGLNPTIFVVGDSDQAIFGFAGATPKENLRDGFDRWFPNGTRLNMTVNFRSQPLVLKRAERLITWNYDDETKELVKSLQAREGVTAGADLSYQWYDTPEQEAEAVVYDLKGRIAGGESPGDFFIMSRTNAQMAFFELELLQAQIPFVNLGVSSFFNRRIPKIIISYMQLAVDSMAWSAYDYVYNIASRYMTDRGGNYCQTRYLGNEFNQKLNRERPVGDELARNQYANNQKGWPQWKNGVQDLRDVLKDLEEFKPSGSAGAFVAKITDLIVKRWMEEEYPLEQDENESAWDDLAVVQEMAGRFTVEEFLGYIQQLQTAEKVDIKELKGFILIGTIYRFKGLERPVVYVVGVSELLLPHRFSLGHQIPTDGVPLPRTATIWDERNLMYVAVTRAKDECLMSGVASWPTVKEALEPSRFVAEMFSGEKVDTNETVVYTEA